MKDGTVDGIGSVVGDSQLADSRIREERLPRKGREGRFYRAVAPSLSLPPPSATPSSQLLHPEENSFGEPS